MIAIVSDIHGNLPALKSVMRDMEPYNVDRIISLGDVSGYYPFINEVIELLKSKNSINLIGNHDRYIIDNSECPRSSSANFCLTYQKSVITDENREWLRSSKNKLQIGEASFVHGGWRDNENEYLYTVYEKYFERLEPKYFFCGHTHVQTHIALKGGKEFTNPGAVGQPRDGINTAAYCLFDEEKKQIELRRSPYDIDKVSNKMKELGFEEKYFENLYTGSRIGGKIDRIEWSDQGVGI